MPKTEALTAADPGTDPGIETENATGTETAPAADAGTGRASGTETCGAGAAPCCPPLTERPFTGEESERAAAMFKALGDPVRVRLFSLVASYPGGEACVCDISDVGVSQPTVSHHLKKLREAGLLTSERRGTWVYYRVEPSVLSAMGRLLGCATPD